MKKSILYFLFSICLLSFCHRLDRIEYSPKISPDTFLQNQHYLEVKIAGYSFIWSQPSSTFIVYFVGLFAMYAGFSFFTKSNNQLSKKWWGAGLLLTGLGALFAGTSYQAFGYEIKCNGNTFCTWTSWWEVVYMLLSGLGINAFLVAISYSNFIDSKRKTITFYAAFNALLYTVVLVYGVMVPVRFLVSFECLVLFSAPAVLLMIVLHSRAFAKQQDAMNRHLRNTWLLMVLVGIAYSVYLSFGITTLLWNKGLWFTENDVLHLGMICWVYYIFKNLPALLKDKSVQ